MPGLNIVFLALPAAILFWLVRSGGVPMIGLSVAAAGGAHLGSSAGAAAAALAARTALVSAVMS